VCQILQFIVSFFERKWNRDLTGDPWNARTLEWATRSPAPHYNFAELTPVTTRDAFWEAKQQGIDLHKPKKFTDIKMPKNTPMGFLIAMQSLVMGFAIVWHIWWLVIVAFLGVITTIIIRLSDDETEYILPAKDVEKFEAGEPV
jgi:cytochrome o ubiquinol oxidase subunit 1